VAWLAAPVLYVRARARVCIYSIRREYFSSQNLLIAHSIQHLYIIQNRRLVWINIISLCNTLSRWYKSGAFENLFFQKSPRRVL
jgi:hypothetical protein